MKATLNLATNLFKCIYGKVANLFVYEFEEMILTTSLLFVECDNGTFGHDCTRNCGKCVLNEQCDHVTGVCPNGCNRGYQGIHCTEGICSRCAEDRLRSADEIFR